MGATCTDDVDECSLFGACGVGYDCANAAMSGDPAVCTDHVDCTASTCANGGTCSENGVGTGLTSCACATGWTGDTCTDDIDECTLLGACGTGYDCANAAVSGDPAVCTDHADCTATTCSNGGTCSENGVGTGLTSCDCSTSTGFSGATCGECAAGKGYEAGTCSDCTFADREWNNEITHNAACATQVCAEGYGVTSDAVSWAATGGNCAQCGVGYESAQGSGVCADVNECQAGTVLGVSRDAVVCGGTSTCQNGVGTNKYTCNCAAGWIGGGDNTLCTQCEAGTYKLGNQCVACDGGSYSTTVGSNSVADCIACGPGTFVLAPGSDEASDCEACVAGQYQVSSGQTACVLCDAGDYSQAVGAQSASTCSDCLSVDRCFTSGAARDACDVQVDIDCEMTAWSHWGTCSTTCNEGDSERTRTEISPACHNGFPCGNELQTKVCINAPCECELVICKYESSATAFGAHDCTDYTAFEISNNGAIANGDHHSNVGVTTAYNAHGNTGLGYAPMPGTVDAHDQSKVCSSENSIRVYHHNGEPFTPREAADAISTGHHCKYTAAGQCKCRCHSSFHHGYNPKAEDRFDYSCGAIGADTDMDWRSSASSTSDNC
jgi:Notch-like protein